MGRGIHGLNLADKGPHFLALHERPMQSHSLIPTNSAIDDSTAVEDNAR